MRRLAASWLLSGVGGDMRLIVDDLDVRIKDFALEPVQGLIVLGEHHPPVRSPAAGTSQTLRPALTSACI